MPAEAHAPGLETVARRCADAHLSVFGAFHPGPSSGAPADVGTLVLLGPRDPGFWDHFTGQPEYADGAPDPLDRWSRRVIGALAEDLGAVPLFPFGGPPHHPFVQWARATGRAHVSPVGLLVHDTAGLMLSFRGALGLAGRLPLPAPPPNPCDSCAARPCLSACPVSALGPDGYDVAACKTDLDRPGNDCMARGCAVRRACPVSQRHGRLEAQSAFHMDHFR
ncbi:ferredoxin [Roseovarius salinarum]|uniref:ferredoxin n=1 Tax=Roseovarius salinarum TaxID=1981892 RepID=UPI0038CD6E1E